MHDADARLIHDMLATVAQRLDRIERLLVMVVRGESAMATDLSALTAAVANETNVVQSAITLIQGLAAEIAANASDPAAVSALASQINSNASALAAAVAANTTPPTPAAAPATPPAA